MYQKAVIYVYLNYHKSSQTWKTKIWITVLQLTKKLQFDEK